MKRASRDREAVLRKPHLPKCLHKIGRGPAHDIFLRYKIDSPDGHHPPNDKAAYRGPRQCQCNISCEKLPGSLQKTAHHDQETQSAVAGNPKFWFEKQRNRCRHSRRERPGPTRGSGRGNDKPEEQASDETRVHGGRGVRQRKTKKRGLKTFQWT